MDDMEIFGGVTTVVDPLIHCRPHLKDSKQLLAKLDQIISLELDIMLEGTRKAHKDLFGDGATVTRIK